jgi:autophagy-related protein 9
LHQKQAIYYEGMTHSFLSRLQRRFVLMGLISLFLSPFIFVYLLVYIFFKYGEVSIRVYVTFATNLLSLPKEVRRTPGSILGFREWTPLARWKFREFNELPHYFQNRLNACYLTANHYIANFPAPLLTIPASFIGFMAGSVVAVMVVLGLVDDDILVYAEV